MSDDIEKQLGELKKCTWCGCVGSAMNLHGTAPSIVTCHACDGTGERPADDSLAAAAKMIVELEAEVLRLRDAPASVEQQYKDGIQKALEVSAFDSPEGGYAVGILVHLLGRLIKRGTIEPESDGEDTL
jgi:hypothetical protein